MKVQLGFCITASLISIFFVQSVEAQHAVEVVSYDAGSTPTPGGFTTAISAIGSPERFTGEGIFPAPVTPFNPPWLGSEVVSIGEGGHLTLRLSNFVLTQAAGPHLGVFTNVALFDTSYPNGQAGDSDNAFGIDSARVEVSEDGLAWSMLGDFVFDIPTNGYTDITDLTTTLPGNSPSDFLKPFTGTLADFGGLQYSPEIVSLLDGSGGGTWLDLSGSRIDKVGYVRFSVLDDGDDLVDLNFELDAVAISRGAIGMAVPEPGGWAWGMMGLLALLVRKRRGWNGG